ncbi:FadR/GntR family transcriptional regulator [Trinickia caryophylli]|uniref:GntR family transcriptional regulator, transcriptional repressor for pyruvate dehydrogenase complex n=1 Tax=Trinickia caryophylli TaxID=28094 RepID=A0A1X7DPX0_TRICW|nr:FadR/GntR family transcriptional regulator [Trinickia caryophylli]PMS10615.1 FadR family transcriptional regulator [Trinickia caryophylli]TRX17208.1 FadR family transcriptional regulator [Trinickia caryophylli]WQE12058.1 FadR/GntR family transcriptional regulator [Trinickia caryophylli]SMF18796.1 GntR family transcriptional regulator, transcriptional repressor for pyruvate dehydrogenase complex [Trinickia caryophylli]GLU31819.1 GntR family transcriptional regulator [Trinickia caryophylli]
MAAKPAETRRLYLQIADKLRALMAQPDFARNGRLPPERELAERLGVSRPSVREALVALELEGRVEIRGGSGVYVCAASQAAGASAPGESELGDSLVDIMGARSLIEGAVAASVAPFAKPKALKALRSIFEKMAQEVDAGAVPIAMDRAFHMAIAQMSGNEVVVRMIGSLFDERHSPLSTKLRGHFESESTWRAALAEHAEILDALEAHDAVQAQAAMQRHLKASLERVMALRKQS